MKDPIMFEAYTYAMVSLTLQLEAAHQMAEQSTLPDERSTYMRQVLLLEKAVANAKIRRKAYE